MRDSQRFFLIHFRFFQSNFFENKKFVWVNINFLLFDWRMSVRKSKNHTLILWFLYFFTRIRFVVKKNSSIHIFYVLYSLDFFWNDFSSLLLVRSVFATDKGIYNLCLTLITTYFRKQYHVQSKKRGKMKKLQFSYWTTRNQKQYNIEKRTRLTTILLCTWIKFKVNWSNDLILK